MALRDAVKEAHDKAEQHRFVKLLFSGFIPAEVYADYLYNQLQCYSTLEAKATRLGILAGLEGMERTYAISHDLLELAPETVRLHPATVAYTEYLDTLDEKGLLAHIYVRHMGDMYGGQMIKKHVPGSATMYDFENRAELIAALRAKLSDDLGDEANKAFDMAIRLFDEVADAHGISAA